MGAHHFAFLRESLLGLDLAEAFHRYLAWSETTTDVRHVQHRCDGLLEHIIDVQADADLTHWVNLESAPTFATRIG